MTRLRVGLIGANPDRGWSAATHLPALAASDRTELVAVCTTNIASAEAAKERFGASHAYTDARALAEHDDLDLVVVSVRAPKHAECARIAIAAGKNVLCEWPLGRSVAEAEALLEAVEACGVRHFVALQGHASPAARHAQALIRSGYLGDLLSVTMAGAHAPWGAIAPADQAYLVDEANGVTAATILGGHSIDMLCALAGEFVMVAGMTANRRPRVARDDGAPLDKTSPDQLLFTGELAGSAVASVHIQGGAHDTGGFTLDLRGTEGTLRLSTPYVPEILPPTLLGTQTYGGSLAAIAIPSACRTAPASLGEGPAVNIAQLYDAIADDIATGSRTAPDFAHAVRRRRLIDAIALSGREGRRVSLN